VPILRRDLRASKLTTFCKRDRRFTNNAVTEACDTEMRILTTYLFKLPLQRGKRQTDRTCKWSGDKNKCKDGHCAVLCSDAELDNSPTELSQQSQLGGEIVVKIE
jgi:hypothetical protein